jgi:hypothetical protein
MATSRPSVVPGTINFPDATGTDFLEYFEVGEGPPHHAWRSFGKEFYVGQGTGANGGSYGLHPSPTKTTRILASKRRFGVQLTTGSRSLYLCLRGCSRFLVGRPSSPPPPQLSSRRYAFRSIRIQRTNQGKIEVESSPGMGSTFTLIILVPT